jgi:crotonobetainyl-CoA:carnitine CoA-transferase CaiB-like acyl-CoA transferase
MQQQNCLPLSGLKVLDLSAYIAGPYGASLLADMGAEVIKIEPPDGDNLRKYPSTLAGESRAFLGVNRGKRGVCLDLKSATGLAVLLKLVETADVLIHNFRPSVPPRLGIDYERLSQLNPRLVYCSLSGYGQSGPLANKAGYDQVLQARTGICTSQGSVDEPQIVYGSVVDYYGASLVSNAVTAALLQRAQTGRGQHVSVSLLAAALAMQAARLVVAASEPRSVNRDMRSGGVTGIHPTKSGHLYISANTPHFWKALCDFVGLSALAQDERYDSVKKRAEHADEIVPKLRQALSAKTAKEWETLFGDEVPCSAVRATEDVFEDTQVQEQALVAEHVHPSIGPYKTVGRPIKFSAATGAVQPVRPAPALGEHSTVIMKEAGFNEHQIKTALEQGAVISK